MALIDSFEKDGNWLFRRRGQLPLILFLLAIPAVWLNRYQDMSQIKFQLITYLSIFVSILGFIIRAYAIGTTPRGTSGRNTEHQVAEVLNTSGIYSTVRHPLYLGNYLMWIGIVLFTHNFYFTIIVSLMYWLYYERIMFAEERFLERKFGDSYLNWARTVPAFFPSFKKYKKNTISFSLRTVLRREYSGILATVIGFAFVELLLNFHNRSEILLSRAMIIICIIAILATVVLRSLKHYTKILQEEGRS